jgi:2-methylcitrate dehydratase PrpD
VPAARNLANGVPRSIGPFRAVSPGAARGLPSSRGMALTLSSRDEPSRALARHVSGAAYADSTRARAAELLVDFLAVAARGAQSAPAATAVPGDAAFFNGVAGHSIELDDTYEPASLHPGVVVWPALLAAGEGHAGASFGELLDAAAAGYDAAGLVGELIGPAVLYERAFHPTGVCGVLGAAAAVCRLHGAGEETVMSAFGIASSQASGLLAFLDDGTWTKPFHAGHAASAGLRAAELALGGYRGPRAVLEGEHGFTRAFGDPDAARVVTAETPVIERTAVKRYPACRYTHSSIDLLVELRRRHELRSGEIEEVRCAIPAAGMRLVAEPPAQKRRIETSVDAQFSMPFTAAVALTDGPVELRHIDSPPDIPAAVRDLMPRVSSHTDARVEASFPAHWAGLVEIRTRDGELLRAEQDDCVDSPARPLDLDALLEKAASLVGDEAAAELAGVARLEHAASVAELGRLTSRSVPSLTS